jgi:hypothetical protein
MADETGEEGEWLDFSSSHFQDNGKVFEHTKEERETEGPEEDFSKLETIRALLKQSLPDASTHVRQNTNSPECAPNSSAINESCKHWYVEINSF